MAYTNQDIESKAREMLAASPLGNEGKALRSACQTAAAVLALSLYLELRDIPNDKIDSFKAGELSVSLRDSTKTGCAQSLRMRAESMLSAYLDCGGFEFKGVVG